MRASFVAVALILLSVAACAADRGLFAGQAGSWGLKSAAEDATSGSKRTGRSLLQVGRTAAQAANPCLPCLLL